MRRRKQREEKAEDIQNVYDKYKANHIYPLQTKRQKMNTRTPLKAANVTEQRQKYPQCNESSFCIEMMLRLTVFGVFHLFADLEHQSHAWRHQKVQERGRKRSREVREEGGWEEERQDGRK